MWRPQIVLCVPGPWRSARQLGSQLRKQDCTLSGDQLITPTAKRLSCELRLAHDPRIERAYRIAGSSAQSLTERDFAAIARHASVLYVLSGHFDKSQAAQTAHEMMQLGCSLLAAGGSAIKCDSSGIAHSAERWQELTKDADQALAELANPDEDAKLVARYGFWRALHAAYVFALLIDADDELYTVGMHLLGRPDAAVARSHVVDDDDALDLLRTFEQYDLAECGDDEPRAGHTFRRHEDEPRFAIEQLPCERYEPDSFFYNPYGYLRLSRPR